MAKKKIDIFDCMTFEMVEAANDLGYKFLNELGYDTEGIEEKPEVMQRVLKELKDNKQTLTYRGVINDSGQLIFFYELVKAGTESRKKPEVIKVSQGLKFIPIKKEDEKPNGE